MKDKDLESRFDAIARCFENMKKLESISNDSIKILVRLFELMDKKLDDLRVDVDKLIENQKGGIK